MTRCCGGDLPSIHGTYPNDMIATGGPVLSYSVATLYNRTGPDLVHTPLDSVNFIFH